MAFVLTSCLPSNILILEEDILIFLFLSQPVEGQRREEEVMSDCLDATFSEKQTGEGHSYSLEPAACAETDQTASR